MSKKRTKYYHADEVAELLGVTTDEVRGMLKRNELKGHKLGRRWLIDMKQPVLENIVSSHEEEEKQEPSFRYIKDSDHEEVIYEKLHSVQSSLYIATANFKNVKFHGITLVSILNEMVSKGVKITIICSKLHVKETYDFEVVVCPRNHMKMFIFDEKYLYIGSANLTPAAIARNNKSSKTNNHEAGILTTDTHFIKQAIQHFKNVYHIKDCETCKIMNCGTRDL